MSDKAKQILSLTIAAFIGVGVYIVVKAILIDLTSNNPAIRILMSGIAGALGALAWFFANRLIAKVLKVQELGK